MEEWMRRNEKKETHFVQVIVSVSSSVYAVLSSLPPHFTRLLLSSRGEQMFCENK